MGKSKRKYDSEDEDISDEEESDEVEENAEEDARLEPKEKERLWKECPGCSKLSLLDTCANPCPDPPLAASLVISRIDSHVRLFEAVCSRGGFAYLTPDDWAQIETANALNKHTARSFYEINLWDFERQQTAGLVKAVLKAAYPSGKKAAALATNLLEKSIKEAKTEEQGVLCGVCATCVLPDCGVCKTCRSKPKYGGFQESTTSCERLRCSRVSGQQQDSSESDDLVTWQRALLASAVFGARPRFNSMKVIRCQLCHSDVTLLSEKTYCADCQLFCVCSNCVSFKSTPWLCYFCEREDAPTLLTMGACAGCGTTFTQTRLSQPCIDCGSPYCSSCVTTDLCKDIDEKGSGLRCFYCRVWSNRIPASAIPLEGKATKRLRLIALSSAHV